MRSAASSSPSALKLATEPARAGTPRFAIVTVEPCAPLLIELSCRKPKGLAASALAAEAVYVFEAAGEHVREAPDLHVQRPSDSDIHAGTQVARGSGESATSVLRGCRLIGTRTAGDSHRSLLRSWCFSYS